MAHDENDCEVLHMEMEFSIRTYALNKGSKGFSSWYRDVFITEHTGSDDFQFSIQEEDGQKFLEIMQMNPRFSIDALESLFEDYRAYNEEKLPKFMKPKVS